MYQLNLDRANESPGENRYLNWYRELEIIVSRQNTFLPLLIFSRGHIIALRKWAVFKLKWKSLTSVKVPVTGGVALSPVFPETVPTGETRKQLLIKQPGQHFY